MEISDELKTFIHENIDLINKNTKESWEKLYERLYDLPRSWLLTGEFTKTIIDAEINDPAEILGYIPESYLHNSNVTNYEIPNNVTLIGTSAFYDCRSLTNIIIPDSVKSILGYAFYNCSSLASVIIPDNVSSIGDDAFYNCSSLKSMVISNSVINIGSYAFSRCSNLPSITIPDNVRSIGYCAFKNCDKLKRVIIGNGVTSIGEEAFENCNSLKEIQYRGTKKQALTKLKVRNKRWRYGSSIEKIICNDGIIEL